MGRGRIRLTVTGCGSVREGPSLVVAPCGGVNNVPGLFKVFPVWRNDFFSSLGSTEVNKWTGLKLLWFWSPSLEPVLLWSFEGETVGSVHL